MTSRRWSPSRRLPPAYQKPAGETRRALYFLQIALRVEYGEWNRGWRLAMSEWIAGNWELISNHPVPFITLAIICIPIGYLLARNQISTLKERIQLYEQKLNGASPDEAYKKIKELEEKIKLISKNQISPDKITNLIEYLKYNTGDIGISTNLVSSFGEQIAEQLHEAFESAGWKVTRSKILADHPERREIILQSSKAGLGKANADRVEHALRLTDIEFRRVERQDDVDAPPSIAFTS